MIMEESQREAMYNGWRRNKEFIDIEVSKLEHESSWTGKCKTKYGFVVYRDTEQEVISEMIIKLASRGCEVGNLPEVYRIVGGMEN